MQKDPSISSLQKKGLIRSAALAWLWLCTFPTETTLQPPKWIRTCTLSTNPKDATWDELISLP